MRQLPTADPMRLKRPLIFRLCLQLPALLAALILAACTALPVAPPTVPDTFAQALQQAGIDPAAVALQVQAVDQEQARFAHNAALSFQPASIM
jgi:D-alanyl-D-alanine carboxypeptidase